VYRVCGLGDHYLQKVVGYHQAPPHNTVIIHQAIDRLEETIDQLRQQIADMTKQADEHVCFILTFLLAIKCSNTIRT
jgi:hypothetical protein